MTIGPDSAHIAPGRIVVTSAYFLTLGTLAIVAGIGPLVVPSTVDAMLIGMLACACGAMLLVGGVSLLVRSRAGRRIAIAASRAALALTILGVILGSATFIGAISPQPVELASAVAGAIVVFGSLINGLVAMASLRAVHITRSRYFKGEVTHHESMREHRSSDAAAHHRVTSI